MGAPYHDREDDGHHSGLEDPEDGEADDLHQSEEVDPPQGHVAEEDIVWLVLGRHQEELAAIPELRGNRQVLSQGKPGSGRDAIQTTVTGQLNYY